MHDLSHVLKACAAPDAYPAETIDVRGLPADESVEQTLAQLESIAETVILVQLNDRHPTDLLTHLDDRGYAAETFDEDSAVVTVIWTAT